MRAHSRPISSSSSCAVIGERNELFSMAITTSTSASRIGSTSKAWVSLLTAMSVNFQQTTLSGALVFRKFTVVRRWRLRAPDRREDRRPERVDPLARLARDEERTRRPPGAAERGLRALAQHAAHAGG